MPHTLNARVGRTRPSPARLRLAEQPHQAGHQKKWSMSKSLYVGALLVAGALILTGLTGALAIGGSIDLPAWL